MTNLWAFLPVVQHCDTAGHQDGGFVFCYECQICSFPPILSNYKLSTSTVTWWWDAVPVWGSRIWNKATGQRSVFNKTCKAFRATWYQEKKRHCALKCKRTLISSIQTASCPHIDKHTLILRNLNLSVIVLSTAGLFVLLICLIQWLLSSALLFS